MNIFNTITEKILLILCGILLTWLNWYAIIFILSLFYILWIENEKNKKKIKLNKFNISMKNVNYLTEELPSWIVFPDKERADWINSILTQLWPKINNYFIKLFRGSIQSNIRKQYDSFKFENINLGCNPPKIEGIKVYNNEKLRNKIIIDFDVIYDGDCDIKFSLSGAKIGGIKDFQLSVVVRVILDPLLAKIPFIGGVQVFFLNSPEIDLRLEGLPGIPGLSTFIRQQIQKKLTKLLLFPNKLTTRFSKDTDVAELKAIEPEGVLRVHVFEGKNLEKKDVTGKSDPYVTIYVGAQEYKTPVIKKSLNPIWDYWCEFIVLDHNSQYLGFKVYDEDKFNEDEYLGSGEIDIKSIVKNKKTDQWIQLNNVKQGQIHLRFSWLYLSSNYSYLNYTLEEIQNLQLNHLNTALFMIYIDSAQNLPMPKSYKKPNPYITLMVDKKKYKTKTKKYTIDPVWQETFTFFLKNPDTDDLIMTINDKDTDSVLEQFVYNIKNIKDCHNLQLDNTEFTLSNPESKIILSMQLKILTQEITSEFSDSDSEDEQENKKSLKEKKSLNEKKSFNSLLDHFKSGLVEITLGYNEIEQKLIVTIHKCILSGKDFNDWDPYVKVQLLSYGNLKFKTRVKENTCNPVFEETFEIPIIIKELYEQKLLITVKSVKNFFNNNTIGQILIDLSEANFKEPERIWYDLTEV